MIKRVKHYIDSKNSILTLHLPYVLCTKYGWAKKDELFVECAGDAEIRVINSRIAGYKPDAIAKAGKIRYKAETLSSQEKRIYGKYKRDRKTRTTDAAYFTAEYGLEELIILKKCRISNSTKRQINIALKAKRNPREFNRLLTVEDKRQKQRAKFNPQP